MFRGWLVAAEAWSVELGTEGFGLRFWAWGSCRPRVLSQVWPTLHILGEQVHSVRSKIHYNFADHRLSYDFMRFFARKSIANR